MDIKDIIVIGAGAAGLMCAGVAGQRKKNVILLEHSDKIGHKIKISGGGRCNFTNLHTTPANFISNNSNFSISALKKYTQYDFISLVEKYKIAYHEKTLGQLFCDKSSDQIIDMLINECKAGNVEIKIQTQIKTITKNADIFEIMTNNGIILSKNVVIASGGLSIPKIGATSFGYDIARQFGLKIVELRPALVPLTFDEKTLEKNKNLAGVAQKCVAKIGKQSFKEAMLFTHRGVSGPAILQISSYWKNGDIILDLLPEMDVFSAILQEKKDKPRQELQTVLAKFLSKKLADYITEIIGFNGFIADFSNIKINQIANLINGFRISPNSTEGFAKAEVTIGGVDTDEISSKTFESHSIKGIYFIGEVLDVTGHLGGFNFQWAWSSGFAAGKAILSS